MAKYHTLQDNEWTRVKLKNQKEACCSCGLVHLCTFKIIRQGERNILYAKFKTNNRATGQKRRHMKLKINTI